MTQPDSGYLLKRAGITIPLIGFYNPPDTSPFQPFAQTRRCFFSNYSNWLKGESTRFDNRSFTCPGAGYWICGVSQRPREDLIKFLVDTEGLKASRELMTAWLDARPPYSPEYPDIVIGPLKPDQYQYLKTVTFFVTPDQLSLLLIGTQYTAHPSDPPPVIAPFGSGCMQLISVFEDLSVPQASLSATDIAMREYLPADILALTMTVPMFENLCRLDTRSFLEKPFWKKLQTARNARRS